MRGIYKDMKSISSNTKNRGNVTIFFFKEKAKYISVCLELDIVKEGKSLEELNQSMMEAVTGYIVTIRKQNLLDELLNRPAPKKYWEKYSAFLSSQEHRVRSRSAREADIGSINVLPMRELCLV